MLFKLFNLPSLSSLYTHTKFEYHWFKHLRGVCFCRIPARYLNENGLLRLWYASKMVTTYYIQYIFIYCMKYIIYNVAQDKVILDFRQFHFSSISTICSAIDGPVCDQWFSFACSNTFGLNLESEYHCQHIYSVCSEIQQRYRVHVRIPNVGVKLIACIFFSLHETCSLIVS